MAIILVLAVSLPIVVGAVYLMLRIDAAQQRKIQRLRDEWEASGRSEPWVHNFYGGPNSGG